MKTLNDYYSEVKKEYNIIMRFATPLTEEMIEKIELHLKKYDLISIGSPKETIFQTTAIGFAEPVNSNVTIINATLSLPVTDYQLILELAKTIKVAHPKVAVTCDYDVGQDAYKEEKDISKEEKDVETYVGKQKQIGPHEINYDHKEFYGDEYNKDMVKTLSDARKEIKKDYLA